MTDSQERRFDFVLISYQARYLWGISMKPVSPVISQNSSSGSVEPDAGLGIESAVTVADGASRRMRERGFQNAAAAAAAVVEDGLLSLGSTQTTKNKPNPTNWTITAATATNDFVELPKPNFRPEPFYRGLRKYRR